MNFPLIRKLSIPVITSLILLCMTGCDLFGLGSDEEPSVSMPLSVKFVEMDSTGTVGLIDSFEVSQPPAVLLDQAVQTTVNSKQLEDAQMRFEGDEDPSGIIVFLYGVNPHTGDFTGPWGAYNPSHHTFITVQHGCGCEEQANAIELNAFFVENIGEVPDEPKKLIIEPEADSIEKVSLEPDPAQHTLPGRFALHLDENDIGGLPERFRVHVQLGKAEESQPDDPVGLLISRWQRHEYQQTEWEGSTFFKSGIPGSGHGIYSNQPIRDFDYYIMVLN